MNTDLNDSLNKDEGKSNLKIFSILSYIGIFWIVGLISERDDPVVRFHINQGIIKTVVFSSLWFVIFVVSKILAAISTILLSIVALLWLAYFLIMFVYVILGIINAKNEVQKPLPIIGDLFHIL